LRAYARSNIVTVGRADGVQNVRPYERSYAVAFDGAITRTNALSFVPSYGVAFNSTNETSHGWAVDRTDPDDDRAKHGADERANIRQERRDDPSYHHFQRADERAHAMFNVRSHERAH
jgi:hypothetical protein